MKKANTILIVGAGPVGCVVAERLANELNWPVQLIERRNHVAGNCFDTLSKNGVLIHQYGPHYFRTNNKSLLDYLSKFTDWIEGDYRVTSLYNGAYYPFPINLNTLRKFFNRDSLSELEAIELLNEKKQSFEQINNSEEFVLSRIGKELYEAFYVGYTLKQWGRHPRELAPNVCGRIPIRFNEDNRYVNHEFQCTPKDGFTAMFQRMLTNPLINVLLETEYVKTEWESPIVVYTGPIDTYFDYCYGTLDWRSIQFRVVEMDTEFHQANVQINYPNDFDYTRSVEIKHVTKQQIDKTVVVYEYPTDDGEPFYPVPTDDNQEKYLKYKELAERESLEKNVYFCGRLAEYTYYNTDEVIERAFELVEQIKLKHANT